LASDAGTGQIYETCKPTSDDKRFAAIGGAPVKEIDVVIDQGKVAMIRVDTMGAYWDELKEAMTKKLWEAKKR
jgi:hypothetical protein